MCGLVRASSYNVLIQNDLDQHTVDVAQSLIRVSVAVQISPPEHATQIRAYLAYTMLVPPPPSHLSNQQSIH